MKKKSYQNEENFVRHLIGTTSLFSWISQWKLMKYYQSDKKNASVFHLNPIISQRFMIGYPLNKVKYGKNPFIAFQTDEYNWASSVSWGKACINIKEKRLYLVSKKIKTIYNDYIPSFAISIEFLREELLNPFIGQKNVSLKHLWYEDEMKGRQINLEDYQNPILSYKNDDIEIPLIFVEDISEVISEADLTTVLTGDSNILDKVRRMNGLDRLNKKIEHVSFIKGNKQAILSKEDKKLLKDLIVPLDYTKPKILIRTD